MRAHIACLNASRAHFTRCSLLLHGLALFARFILRYCASACALRLSAAHANIRAHTLRIAWFLHHMLRIRCNMAAHRVAYDRCISPGVSRARRSHRVAPAATTNITTHHFNALRLP